MDAALLSKAQQLEAASNDAEAAINARVEALAANINTCMPGIIRSYDEATQSVTVQPAIKRIFIGKGAIDLPVLVDVPVKFPRGGGFVLTFPISKGDECLLSFSQRAIDFWWKNGGVQLPSEYRMHDLSDAFADVGYSSVPNAVKNVRMDAVELRSVDGSNRIALCADGSIILGAATKTGLEVPPLQGVVLGTGIDTLTEIPFFALGDASMTVRAKQ
jgi:hypothetical protein